MGKRTINWKDPQIRQLMDAYLDSPKNLKRIDEFAAKVNAIFATDVSVSTIRNRVYQEQRERGLILEGIKAASSTASTTPPTPGSSAQQVNVLQAVPVYLQGEGGIVHQAYAILQNASQQIILNNNNNNNNNNNGNGNGNVFPGPSCQGPDTPFDPMPSSSTAFPCLLDNNLSLRPPSSSSKPPEYTFAVVDDPTVDLVPGMRDLLASKAGTDGGGLTPLPKAFLELFDPATFKMEANGVREFTVILRDNLSYLIQATDVYPRHPSFLSGNKDVFQRNLNVFKEAGDYFTNMLSVDRDPSVFPNQITDFAEAVCRCLQNGTGTIDQMALPPDNREPNLPGCKVTRHGMITLCGFLDGVLRDIEEGVVAEFDKFQAIGRAARVHMMMLTLHFARSLRLAGALARGGLEKITDEESQILAIQLNESTFVRFNHAHVSTPTPM